MREYYLQRNTTLEPAKRIQELEMELINALSLDRPINCSSKIESKRGVNRCDGNAISRRKTQTPSDDMRAL